MSPEDIILIYGLLIVVLLAVLLFTVFK